MNNVIQMPGSASEADSSTELPIPTTPADILSERLRDAAAVVDLIHFSDRESLYDDTVNNALWVVDRCLTEAREAAEALFKKKTQPR